MPSSRTRTHPLEDALNYTFHDKSLLTMALTHKSYAVESGEPDNERLEFLGDAIISAIVTPLLFRLAPDASEGQLSRLRSRVVSETGLASLARHLKLSQSLRLGKSELMSSGGQNNRLLCSAFEAVVGAVFIDANFKAVTRIFEPIIEPGVRAMTLTDLNWTDPRSALQEVLQASQSVTPTYAIISQDGPPHNPVFTVSVMADDAVLATATGPSKSKAKLAAATAALSTIKKDDTP